MAFGPRSQQPTGEIVRLRDWQFDDEFPYGPQGAKPKRVLICPEPKEASYLIGGHRYLFKEPAGGWAQQIWSEIIAYEIGRRLGIDVPPAFAALDPYQNISGVLVEFFYGYPWEDNQTVRFVQAADLLERNFGLINFERGSLRDNVRLCRILGVPGWGEWWSKTLVFDAIIGNTDRHSQNWGFLALWAPGAAAPTYSLAPAFDNGTSLGYRVREEDLVAFRDPARRAAFVQRGSHHYGWLGGDAATAQHARLCAVFGGEFRSAVDVMRRVASGITDAMLDNVLERCTRFELPVRFTEARAEFVATTTKMRRDAVLAALGEA